MDQSEITPTTAKLSLRIVSALRYFSLHYRLFETALLTAAPEPVPLTFPTMYLQTLLLKAATRIFQACLPLIRKQGGISVSRHTFGRIYISLHLVA